MGQVTVGYPIRGSGFAGGETLTNGTQHRRVQFRMVSVGVVLKRALAVACPT